MLDEALWWNEYGGPSNPREMSTRRYQAHMAIIRGKQEERAEEQRKQEREAQRARNQAR